MTSFEKKLSYDESNVSYFRNSPEIKESTIRYAKNLQRYYIYYANFDVKQATLKLAEIDSYMSSGHIKNNSLTQIYNKHRSSETTGPTLYSGDSYNVKPESLYNFDVLEATNEEIVSRQELLNDAISNYNTVQEYIRYDDDFHFLIYDASLSRTVATNSEDFYNENSYETIQLSDDIFNVSFNGELLNSSFTKKGLRCFISIPSTTSNEIKLNMLALSEQIKCNRVLSSVALPLCLAFSGLVLLLVVWLCSSGYLFYYKNKIYNQFVRLPIIVRFPVLCMLIAFIVKNHLYGTAYITEMYTAGRFLLLITTLAISCISVGFIYLSILHLIRLFKEPTIFLQEKDIRFVSAMHNDIRLAVNMKRPFMLVLLIPCVIIIVAIYCTSFIVLLGVGFILRTVGLYICLMLCLTIAILVYKAIISEIKLRYYIKEMADGNIDTIPPQKGLFSTSINNINNINSGLKKIMDETLKSERLKTELITNVSHDLKTPLTSIISYVDLLDSLELDNEKASEYISVIKSKSRRLKILIEDLFEASKLSSGQMKLELACSDVVALLEQTLGELDDAIQSSDVAVITDLPDYPILLNIDGQKMWRAFDNIVNNMLKYSAKGSRAFVLLEDTETSVVITFKNVANYQMDFEADELFERFKRGDKARATEGSGLGLSITKSIIELHGGKMNIVTDGDLFKINIVLFKS
jgi:signal transduction histidine kinase